MRISGNDPVSQPHYKNNLSSSIYNHSQKYNLSILHSTAPAEGTKDILKNMKIKVLYWYINLNTNNMEQKPQKVYFFVKLPLIITSSLDIYFFKGGNIYS